MTLGDGRATRERSFVIVIGQILADLVAGRRVELARSFMVIGASVPSWVVCVVAADSFILERVAVGLSVAVLYHPSVNREQVVIGKLDFLVAEFVPIPRLVGCPCFPIR